MNKKLSIVLAALVLAVPPALASLPPYKDYCEDPSADWPTHKYYGGATVNDKTAGLGETGVTVVSDGNVTGDCNGDGVPADFDGHFEFGVGGAVLTYTVEDPNFPGCAIEAPHHAGTIHVEDRVFGHGVTFTVGADYDCDGITDISIKCFGWCDPPFPPGADGAYWVFVHAPATKGTVTNVAFPCGPDVFFITGKPTPGAPNPNTYTGKVTLTFTVGGGATLTGESVTWTGGPGPSGAIVETAHTGAGGGSVHQWTIGPVQDINTREYTYKFDTLCLGDGSMRTTTGKVYVFN